MRSHSRGGERERERDMMGGGGRGKTLIGRGSSRGGVLIRISWKQGSEGPPHLILPQSLILGTF